MTIKGITGVGATITFGTSNFSGKYREITETEQERQAVDTTTLDVPSANNSTNIPGDNPSPGQTRCRIRFDASVAPPPLTAAETITITTAKDGSATNAANLAGSGYILKRRILPNLQRNTLAEGEFTIQWDGQTGPTFTPQN